MHNIEATKTCHNDLAGEQYWLPVKIFREYQAKGQKTSGNHATGNLKVAQQEIVAWLHNNSSSYLPVPKWTDVL